MYTTEINILYSIFFLVLLPISIYNIDRVVNSFLIAIGLNVFPLMFIGQLSNIDQRLIGIPTAYLPIFSSMIAFAIVSKFRIDKLDQNICLSYLFLMSYLFVQSLITVKHYDSFIIYFSMWILNIYTMLSISCVFSTLNLESGLLLLRRFVLVIAISSIIGIMRKLSGISVDANFMPLMNRNGTIFVLIPAVPLSLLLFDLKMFNRRLFISLFLIFLINMLLLQSRTGFLGFFLSVFMYYFFKNKIVFLKITTAIFIIVVIVLLTRITVFLDIARRLGNLASLFQALIAYGRNATIEATVDYKRIIILLNGIQVIKNNFLLGTGVGLDNYREYLKPIIDGNKELYVRPHNFYVSYLAEFGIIGFSILLFIIYQVWHKTSILIIGRSRNIRLPMYSFRAIIITLLIMLAFNEYVTYPLVWILLGIILGMSNSIYKNKAKISENVQIHSTNAYI